MTIRTNRAILLIAYVAAFVAFVVFTPQHANGETRKVTNCVSQSEWQSISYFVSKNRVEDIYENTGTRIGTLPPYEIDKYYPHCQGGYYDYIINRYTNRYDGVYHIIASRRCHDDDNGTFCQYKEW